MLQEEEGLNVSHVHETQNVSNRLWVDVRRLRTSQGNSRSRGDELKVHNSMNVKENSQHALVLLIRRAVFVHRNSLL